MDARDIKKNKSENDTKTDRSPDRIIDNNMNKTVNKSARVVITKNRKIAYRGMLTALAMVLSYLESFIPVFAAVPGIKIGLANIVTVFAIVRLSIIDAAAIGVIRVVLSALLFGNPVMIIYSFAGLVLSIAVMALASKLPFFGTMGMSILGGVAHNLGQLLVAAFIVGNTSILYYLGILLVVGAVSGAVVGIMAGVLLKRV